jgi:hypothetical protein
MGIQPVQGDNSAKRNRNPTSAGMYHRLLGRNWQPRNLLSECPEFAMQHYPATAEALVHRTSSWSGLEALGWCCGSSISFGSWNAVVNPGLEGWNLQMDNDSIYNQDHELLKHILIRAWWSQSRMQHYEHSDADIFGGCTSRYEFDMNVWSAGYPSMSRSISSMGSTIPDVTRLQYTHSDASLPGIETD